MSQDGDSLMDVLQPYLYTGVNLTTFKFRYEGSGSDTTSNAADDRYDDDDHFATVHDSLLTLYRGVRLRWRDFGSCQWAGSNLLPTLAKVSIPFCRPSFCKPFVYRGIMFISHSLHSYDCKLIKKNKKTTKL